MVHLLETYITHGKKCYPCTYSLCYDDWVWLYVFIINSYFSGAYNSARKHCSGLWNLDPRSFFYYKLEEKFSLVLWVQMFHGFSKMLNCDPVIRVLAVYWLVQITGLICRRGGGGSLPKFFNGNITQRKTPQSLKI